MRDLRDPQALGASVLEYVGASGFRASQAYDRFASSEPCVLVPEADGVYVGPVERYGDPRVRHSQLLTSG